MTLYESSMQRSTSGQKEIRWLISHLSFMQPQRQQLDQALCAELQRCGGRILMVFGERQTWSPRRDDLMYILH